MNLLGDILTWSQAELSAWQQDALRRLFQQDSHLSAADYDELYVLLKAGHDIARDTSPKPIPLSSAHLPSVPTRGDAVILKKMCDLQDVNRLAKDQSLVFSPTGITVVYGPNASGKSGYARVLKRACRSRDDSEAVLPDARVLSAQSCTPTAAFEVEKSGVPDFLVWQEGSTPPIELSEIAVFDARCARLYLTQEQDVEYLPYGLDIVEALGKQVIPEVERRLDAEIEAISVDVRPFDHLAGATAVGRLIAGLSASTTPEEVKALATLSEAELARLSVATEALAEPDPQSKATALIAAAKRIKELVGRIDTTEGLVDDAAAEGLKELCTRCTDATNAERAAADGLRAGERLLPGTGEAVWRILYEAARRFSVEVAYPGRPFPNTDKDAVCPLCQRELSPSSAERLTRFESYVEEDVAKSAATLRDRRAERQQELENVSLDVGLGEALSSELKLLDDSAPDTVRAFEHSLRDRRAALVEALRGDCWEEAPPLAASPRRQLRHLAADLLWQARALKRATREGEREALEAERAELSARSHLAASEAALCDLLANMKRAHKLEQCREELKTRPISNKSKSLASKSITKALKNALEDEFIALNVTKVKLKLVDRIERGTVKHRLVLDLPTTCKLDDVLSEGEQRAIAIGSFMAELSLANHDGGVVFDDPVSSLDHSRRRRVAQRLVAEAKCRQVIVFTHDTSFLGQLCDEIEAVDLPRQICSLEWAGDHPGKVQAGLPWSHQRYMERIDTLEKAQRQLERIPWPQYPSDDQVSQMATQYSRLRATIECVIQDVVFCGVIVRFRDWVNVRYLKDVGGLEPSEFEVISQLHKRCCQFTDAHDSPSEKDLTIPTAQELAADIQSLKDVVEAIKRRRKASSAPRVPPPS